MNLKIFTINGVAGNKIWQMTNGGSIGQLLFHGQRSSGETVPRHFHMELPQLYKVDRWIHNRSPVIVQTEHGQPMSNDRLLSVAWFFFPWEKVNREARTRFHNVNSGLVCLKPTRESRYPSYSDRQYLFILIHPWYNITPS